jgi:hypothetical protein
LTPLIAAPAAAPAWLEISETSLLWMPPHTLMMGFKHPNNMQRHTLTAGLHTCLAMPPYNNNGFLNNRLQQKLESKLRQQVACVQPATPGQQDRRVIRAAHKLQHFDKSWVINAAKAFSSGAHHNASLPDKAPSRLPGKVWWQACWLLHLETSCCCLLSRH